jgi:hypothetical protein
MAGPRLPLAAVRRLASVLDVSGLSGLTVPMSGHVGICGGPNVMRSGLHVSPQGPSVAPCLVSAYIKWLA